MSGIRIGVNLPSHGPDAIMPAPEAARLAEKLGFDSVWMSDHVVMVESSTSPYPFDADGKIRWDLRHPMSDALITLTAAGAVTTRVGLGTCVLIAPMRNPIVLAKQLATLDVLTGGRFTLGVGVGWLAEEFAALGAPFEDRGTRLNEWMEIMRDCWTGRPAARRYRHWQVPPGIFCYPTPAKDIPILVGGMSRHAIRRAGRHADGWIGFQYTQEINPEEIRKRIEMIRREAARAGRPTPPRLAMQSPGPTPALAERLTELADAGLTEVVISVDWTSTEGVEASLNLLRCSAP